MPIYAYRCTACGHEKEHLQKMSDAPLTDCPKCGAATYKKQLTAAGFQLKGTGWYVTDFKGGNNKKAAPASKDATVGKDSGSTGESSSGTSSSTKESTGAVGNKSDSK